MTAAHYTQPEPKASRIQYLVIISASILIMLCSGAVYAWSIFVAPLQSEFGFTNTETQIVFGLIICCFHCRYAIRE